jgi:hypothetical protein
MKIVVVAQTAYEWAVVWKVGAFTATSVNCIDLSLHPAPLQIFIYAEPAIEALPYSAELGKRSEDWPFQLIEIVIECVGILQETVLFVRDGQLNFTQNVSIFYVD